MNFIKKTFFFLVSLISLLFFYYLLGFVFIFFESLSDLWIIILSIIGGGGIGFATISYSMLLDKLIPSSKFLNWIFIIFNLVLGVFNILLHWQINTSLVARVFYALIIGGACLMLIRSRLLVTDN